MEGIRFGEKALAERCVNLIRKGADSKDALGELAACLQSATAADDAADCSDFSGDGGDIAGQISQFKRQVSCVADALATLCGRAGNPKAVQEVQKQRAATPGAATSITSIVNAALSTSRFWQDRLRDCLGVVDV